MMAKTCNHNKSGSVSHSAAGAKSSAGHRWHLRTAGWPFRAPCSASFQVSQSKHPAVSCPGGSLRLASCDSTALSLILPVHVQSPCPIHAIGRTSYFAGGMRRSWFSVCAYFVKFNETVLFLGSRQDHRCWVQFNFLDPIQPCLSVGHD